MLEQLPGHACVRLDDGPKVPRGEPVRGDGGCRCHRRRARTHVDQSDLAEIVARLERVHLLAVNGDGCLTLADDEEADAAFAFLGEKTAIGAPRRSSYRLGTVPIPYQPRLPFRSTICRR